MSVALRIFRAKNRLSSYLFPDFTAEKASELFLAPRRFPVKNWEVDAENSGVRKRYGERVSAIVWGSGDRTVLLMHGWESRATQLYRLITPLLSQGYRVIGLDGPAHGQSKGSKANPLMFAQAIALLYQHEGPFEAMIGHSMGGSAVAISLSEGVETKKVVLISSPSSILTVLERFAKFIGLNEDVCHRFVRVVSNKVGRDARELDITELLARQSIPLLIIHDEHDIEIPIGEGEHIARSVPNSKFISTSSLGHRKIISDPLVRDNVAQFLAS